MCYVKIDHSLHIKNFMTNFEKLAGIDLRKKPFTNLPFIYLFIQQVHS